MSYSITFPYRGELYGLFLLPGGRRYARRRVTHQRLQLGVDRAVVYLCDGRQPRLIQNPDRTVLDLYTGLRYRNFGHWLKFRDEGLPHD